jgi:hypothetical protein
MRTLKEYCYNQPEFDAEMHALIGNQVIIISEDAVLAEYYPHWCALLHKAGKAHLISRQRCLDDWMVVNGAWEKPETP